MGRIDTPDNRLILALIIALSLIYIPFILSHDFERLDFIKGDCSYYRAAIISILSDHDLFLDNNTMREDPLCGQLALGKKNRLVPKHPIIMPVLSIPFYMLFKSYGLLLFNVIDAIILMILIFKLNRLFFNEWVSFATTIIYATGTLFLDYVYNYSPDILSTVMVVGGLYFILKKRYHVGALLLGLSLFAKVSNIVPAGLIIAYAVFVILKGDRLTSGEKAQDMTRKVTTILVFLLVFLIALAPLLMTNYELFGSPFVTGYQRTAERGDGGRLHIFDHMGHFDQPFLLGARRLLFLGRWGIV
ncbi:MAG: hypothetical protein JW800_01275, partial [Candidatus Omnitrophica bacterium]|nr:hypothetical protein [Candidatus Omnitrophota bacterium]